MKILIIGGTIFVGRTFVEVASKKGHELTLFHRGKTGSDLFPNIEHVHGDRDGGLNAIGKRTFDAIVDCCGYYPRVVRQSADYLEDKVGRYLFVSSISVYKDLAARWQDESAEVGQLEDPTKEEMTGESYGPLKALCEEAITDAYGERAFNVRPGLIAGPYDRSNRFPYWVEQFATTDAVLAPDRPLQPQQLIDVRDLCEFMLLGLETGLSGAFNVTGPDTPKTFLDMMRACQTINPQAEIVWASEQELKDRDLELWQDLPLVLPFDGSMDGMHEIDVRKAVSAGLRFRDWAETAQDTWTWLKDLPADRPRMHGAKKIDAKSQNK